MKQRRLPVVLFVLALAAGAVRTSAEESSIRDYRVPAGSHPHDVAPAPDGSAWYTAQNAGALGRPGESPQAYAIYVDDKDQI